MKILAHLRTVRLFGLIFTGAGCTAEPETAARGDATLRPALVSQRVNAVVRRQSQQLLYLDTEHQSFVTTPEHPFATIDSGWVPARDLAPGDRVISAKFGSLRVSSVRIEAQARPVSVFNLGVDRSRAYWVGSAGVLVHNTGCRDGEDTITLKTKAVEETKQKLDALRNGAASSSSEQPHVRQQKIAELESQLKRFKNQLAVAKSTAKRKAQEASPAGWKSSRTSENNVVLKTRKLAEAKRDLDALKNTKATSLEHARELEKKIAELKAEVDTLDARLRDARYKEKKRTRPELIDHPQPAVPRGDALKQELAAARAELHELRRERSTSLDPMGAPTPRETQLEKLIREHTFDLKKENELRKLEDELAKLEKVVPTPDDPRPELESEKQKLKKLIQKNKEATRVRKAQRKRIADPEVAAKKREYDRAWGKRTRRSSNYVNDPERPRDDIDRLEDELAELDQLPSSPGRDARMTYTKARLEKLKRLAELRLELTRVRSAISSARKERESLIQEGEDATITDDELAELDRERKELVQQIATERARDILDGVDEEHHTPPLLDATEPFSQEYLDQLLHEIQNEQGARQDQLEQNTRDVDEEMQFINGLLVSTPPAPPAEVHAAVARLRSELHDERAQFNDNNFALTNEYAYLNTTLGPGNPAGARRMAEIQAKIKELEVAWQKNTLQRLDEARRVLRDMQQFAYLRDETVEAELAEQIALLEHELNNPPFGPR